MKFFAISDLERFSGIKAHTIRIWEQRYQIFTPQRTDGNTRLYSIDDVRLLLNVALLVKKGVRISALAKCTPTLIEEKIHLMTFDIDRYQEAIHHLIVYRYSSDIELFGDLLDSCVLTWGIDTTIEKIIIPFLEKAELLSYSDRKSETHFAVTAIRRKIILGIEKVKAKSYGHHAALLFLAEGEHYDLMLLYMEYLLKQKGIRVLYLGTNVPFEDIKETILLKKPELLYTYVPQKHKFKLHGLIPIMAQQKMKMRFFVVTCETVLTQQNYANLQFVSYKEILSTLKAYESSTV